MARNEFIPATIAEHLAATWIQFMVKDWFGHGHRGHVPGVQGPASNPTTLAGARTA